ncbi:MAG TPA: DUF177 domain-containing protein [Candidatus Sulfotelmatobacter sp.]|nr:DUF177 domain-containing protein [Candidatus Sulfotelmatobacter sp.]
MLIDVSQIPPDGLDVTLPDADLDLGTSMGVWAGPATVRAGLHIGRTGRGVLIQGSFAGGVTLLCGRCLEPFRFGAEDRFDVYCRSAAPPREPETRELTEDELDVMYLEEGRIDTDALLRENFLLSLPVQPLCHEDCQGLCPRCGADLNQGPCRCGGTQTDPRLQVLRKLL